MEKAFLLKGLKRFWNFSKITKCQGHCEDDLEQDDLMFEMILNIIFVFTSVVEFIKKGVGM